MKKWLKVLLLADFFMMFAIGMLTPIYAIFVKEIGGDILAASGAWAIFTFTCGILIFIIGRWEDRVQHLEKMVFLGYMLRCFTFIGYFFVANKFHLFGVQVLLGIGAAMTLPAYDSLYSKLLSKGHYASEWGAWEGMDKIVAGVAAIVGGLIASYFGFRVLFLVMFFSSLVGLFISAKLFSKGFKRTVRKK